MSAVDRVRRHVWLYGLDRVLTDPWCPQDFTREVIAGQHPKATGPYPFILCNPLTLVEVTARIGLENQEAS